MFNAFRKLLIEIRRRYKLEPFTTLYFLLGATIGTSVVSLLLDLFLPYDGAWMFLRSIWLIPTAVSIFSLGYLVSIYLHNAKINENPDWTTYRSRFSQRTRIRFSIIAGAFLFVCIYIIPKEVGYTLFSSCIAAFILGILAFVRMTSAEQRRLKLGIPDSRDVSYDFHEREYQKRVEQQKLAKKKKKVSD